MKRTSRPRRLVLARFRPGFEVLEARTTPAMLTVSTLNDAGSGSLRQAILDANSMSGADTIDFSIAGTINLTSAALPPITEAVTLDGTSAPGFATTPVVEVNANGFAGLVFNAGSAQSSLLSLGIVNASGAGVSLNDDEIVIAGNFIGLRLNGTTTGGNSGDGITIAATATSNTIGGTTQTSRNVISGNAGNGISVLGSTGNQIIGNYVGTDGTGKLDRGNALNGILLTNAAAANTIGGDTTQFRNVISGNQGNGVLLNQGARDNKVAGNYIGTDMSGGVALGNGQDGVQVINASNNLIGRSDPVVGVNYYNADQVNTPVSFWQGIRAADTPGQYLIVGTSAQNGLLFEGTIQGVGATYAVNYPGAATTSVYGPDNRDDNELRLVGSYKNADASTAAVKVHGFIFEGTTADLYRADHYKDITFPGSEFNYVHSVMGDLAVGNYDKPVDHGKENLPLGPGRAFIYDVTQGKFITDIIYPGSKSNSAYGIWHNGENRYTIVGGYSPLAVNNFDDQNRPIGLGFMVDYDARTGEFNNWASFEYPKGVDFVTHFEGISSVEKGVYTLSADSVQAGTNDPAQGSLVTVRRNPDGTFGPALWQDLNYAGLDPSTTIASSNSVYGNQVVGEVFGAGAAFAFQSTVNVAFQLSNVISGNGGNGVTLSAANDNQVAMNYIGTDVTGTLDRGNGGNGILLTAGSAHNRIGGEATGGNNPTDSVFVRPPQGNLISGNDANGVLLNALATDNTLAGNFIGTTAAGTAALGNKLDGVALENAPGNRLIGCTFRQDPFVFYNVIGGNEGNGVRVTNSNDVVIQANFLGMGADNLTAVGNKLNGALINGSSANTQFGGVIPLGNVAAGNGRNGVEIADTATGGVYFNTFAGLPAFITTAVPNALNGFLISSTGGNNLLRTNVISGNTVNGIHITGFATGVQVTEAIIGLTTTGTGPLPNGANGVLIDGNAHDNVIGGLQPSIIPESIIGANGANGIAIVGQAIGNKVVHSRIGTSSLGTEAFGNTRAGIFVGGNARDTIIGGTGPGDRNLISANLGGGIQLAGESQGTRILGNRIGTNRTGDQPLPNQGNGIWAISSHNEIGGTADGAGNVIAFNPNGVQVDTGTSNAILANSIFSNTITGIVLTANGNHNQAAPLLTGAFQPTPTTIKVNGIITAAANTTYTLEFFATPSSIPAGQGQNFLGTTTVTTDASGHGSFGFTSAFTTADGSSMTATATDPSNNTSAFSAPISLKNNSANELFVASAYGLLLNRTTDAGSTFWVSALNSGASPASVVRAIEGSAEYLADQVDALYRHYLKRAPDAAGAQHWLLMLQNGGTLEEAAAGFASSAEYFQLQGNTNQGFVLGLYRDVLGRTASQSEIDGWVAFLTAGATRHDVALGFLTSTEYRTNLVGSYYHVYLGRDADADGLAHWLSAFQSGATDQDVLANIFGSPEGFARWS